MHMPRLLPILLAPIALAVHLRLIIPSSTALPNPNVLPPSTSATLTTLSQVLNSPLRADNVFDFRNVSSGSYLLDIHCHTNSFAPLRVDVHEGLKLENGQARDVEEIEVFGTFRGNEWSNKGPVVDVTEVSDEGDKRIWGFMVKAQGEKEYLMERSGCEFFPPIATTTILLICDELVSPLSLLKNPMILIAGVSMIVVFGMPYLMDNSSFFLPLFYFLSSLSFYVLISLLLQWTQNSVPNSKSAKRLLHSREDKPQTHYKISMLRLGWRVQVADRHRREVGRLCLWREGFPGDRDAGSVFVSLGQRERIVYLDVAMK